MSGTLGKMAPTAILFMLLAWCCWPYLERPRSTTGVGQGSDLPRITGALLSPTVEPASVRDPFQPPQASQPAPSPSKKPTAPPPEQPKAAAAEKVTDVFAGLSLGAIYIRGDRRVALINDRVYAQGERLTVSASAAEPYIVGEISADKVLLLHRGQTVELKYAGLDVNHHATKAVEQRREQYRRPQ